MSNNFSPNLDHIMNQASVFESHKRFKEGKESVRMMRGVAGVRKSIHQS